MPVKVNIGVVIPPGLIMTGKVKAVLEAELEAGYKEAGLFLEGEVAKRTPVNSGRLRKSISSRVRGVGLRMYGQVFSPLEYARYVEEGQKPHMPPDDPIRLWVKRKMASLKAKLKKMMGVKKLTKEIKKMLPTSAGQAKIAWVVRKKIAKYGVKAIWMFKKTFNSTSVRWKVRGIFLRHRDRFIAKVNK